VKDPIFDGSNKEPYATQKATTEVKPAQKSVPICLPDSTVARNGGGYLLLGCSGVKIGSHV
jgi:hypothetical protein